MAHTPEGHRRRSEKVRRRAAAPAVNLPAKCSICGKPTMRAAAKGLTVLYCRAHQEHYARHGSYWHKSYSARDLKPHLKASTTWLRDHRDDLWVAHSRECLDGLLDGSGRAEPATSLRGRPPRERACIALARLREAGIRGERLLATMLAVAAIHEEDPISPHKREFRQVQVAKACHRLASGFHRKYEWPMKDGTTGIYAVSKYARSTGRVLRHLGKAIEEAGSHALHEYVAAVLAFKIERYGRHPDIGKPAGRR